MQMTTRTHPPRRSGRLGTIVVAISFLALLLAPASASAARQHPRPLPFGHWVAFDAGAAGTFDARGLFAFASQTPVVLRVTDGFCRGDRFRVLDHGRGVLTTTSVGVDTDCDRQPFATSGPAGWHDRGYSRGRLVLGPGRHRIRIRSLRSPFGGSTGFIEALRVR
jgi:hypothetical protein